MLPFSKKAVFSEAFHDFQGYSYPQFCNHADSIAQMDYGRRCDDLAETGSVADDRERTSRNGRTLTRRLLADAHFACDYGEFDVARGLLELAERVMIGRNEHQGASGRRLLEQLVLGFERVWELEHRALEMPSPLDQVRFESLRQMLLRPGTDQTCSGIS